MKYKIQRWWSQNDTEITWFINGYLVSTGFQALGQGDWLNAIIAFGFVYINYALHSRR